MARRVFFSFDPEGDAGRAEQVRRSGAVSEADMEGFFTRGDLDDSATPGDAGLRQLIQKHIRNTSVTVVLIGAGTANSPWVRYAIDLSIEQRNALVGIYVGHLKDPQGRTPTQGLKPSVPEGVDFPAYSWDGDRDRLIREIVAAGRRADSLRARHWAFRQRVPPVRS